MNDKGRPAAPALPELQALERAIAMGGSRLEARVVGEARTADANFPVHVVTLGNPDPAAPVLGVFGGVHGLERIGAAVALSCLQSVVVRLRWDTLLARQLEAMRLVFMPLVNPGGLWRGTRSNPQGVDLMRNAPVRSSEGAPFLLGGHRLGGWLPWYRGPKGAAMQAESRALCEVVEAEILSHDFAITVDCHSGFGLVDRVWFPHAHTRRPIEHLPEMLSLCDLFDETHRHHRYLFEPQSRAYLAHGDLWDHLYLRACERPDRVLLPLTLEMGSWLWVKKNPRQMFSLEGMFNPLVEHREQRVLRRHTLLLDFLMRAACSPAHWRPAAVDRAGLRRRALQRWYGAKV